MQQITDNLKYIKIPYQNIQEWNEIRRTGTGGSDAGAVAGVHRWKSRLETFLEKVGQIEPQEENEKMYWGKRLEAMVAEEFCIRTCKKVERMNYVLRSKQYPFMLANIDRRVVGEKAGLECKTSSEWSGKDILENDFLPEHILQVQHYLAVTGWDRWYLAILIGGQRFHYREVLPDPEIISYLIKIESDFWKLVEAGTPPEPDGSDTDTEIINSMYPKSNSNSIALPETALELIKIINECKDTDKALSSQKAEAENKLKAMLGENEVGNVDRYIVSWKNVTSNRTDTKALKERFPEIASQVLKESTTRRFEVKESKIK